MPRERKKSAADKQLEQSKRFEEAARKSGGDESGRAFERAFSKLAPAKNALRKKKAR
jgi:hypothetical protein